MKATGIVRRIDELGRVVLPMELRKTLNIEIANPLEIYVDGENIVLKKYKPGCYLCGSADDLLHIEDKLICHRCAEKIAAGLRSISEEDKP